MTTLTFHLARALGRGLGPGDEIVVTELDHHANVDALAGAGAGARRDGPARCRCVPRPGSSTGRPRASVIGPRTRLLAIGAASNALGTINDVRRAAALAGAVGAL